MTTKKTITGLIFTVFFAGLTFGQNVGISESSSFNPDNSAMLHVESTSKGLLIPRVQLDDVATAAPVSSPANGLMIFNATGSEMHGFYYWDGASRWRALNHFSESGNGLIYNTGNTEIGINQVDTAFLVNGGIETTTTHGRNIVLRAGTTNSTAEINGGNILFVPGKGSGTSGTDGKVEVKGELVTDAGFFQYRGDITEYDFTVTDFTIDHSWHNLDLSSIVPLNAKAVQLSIIANADAAGKMIRIKKAGSVLNICYIATQILDQYVGNSITVPLDNMGIVEYDIDIANWSNISVVVMGWWK